MHKISALLLSILLISLTGCEEKPSDEPPIPVEDTTEIFDQPQDNTVCVERPKSNTQTKSHYDNTSIKKSDTTLKIPDVISGTNTFILLNTKSKSHKVTISNDQVIFHRNAKPIVLINIFATWCPPCIGELPYLNILQKKYSNDLFIAGILTQDYIDAASLESFIAKHEINYYISSSPHNNAFSGQMANTLHLPQNFPIPLTIMYVDGKYFTHYEGSVPAEMIEYDIQQAQKQLKIKSN